MGEGRRGRSVYCRERRALSPLLPYLNQGLGIVVLSSISGIHTPEKMGAMVSLADIAVVTKIDLVSQAEREVLVQKIREVHPSVVLIETNALQGSSLQRLYQLIRLSDEVEEEGLLLKGNPPWAPVPSVWGKRGGLEEPLRHPAKARRPAGGMFIPR